MARQDWERAKGRIERIARGLSRGIDWEDLSQEGALEVLHAPSGQTDSWYLHRAKMAMQHYQNAGRSLDSKRRPGLARVAVYNQEGEPYPLRTPQASPSAELMAKDLRERIEATLSEIEKAIFSMTVEGYTTREIGQEVGRDFSTVSRALGNIRRKTQRVLQPA